MPLEDDYRIELQRAMDVFKSSIQSLFAKAREERLRRMIDEVKEEEPTDEELGVLGSDDIRPAQEIGNGPARYSPSLEHGEPAGLVQGMERTYNNQNPDTGRNVERENEQLRPVPQPDGWTDKERIDFLVRVLDLQGGVRWSQLNELLLRGKTLKALKGEHSKMRTRAGVQKRHDLLRETPCKRRIAMPKAIERSPPEQLPDVTVTASSPEPSRTLPTTSALTPRNPISRGVNMHVNFTTIALGALAILSSMASPAHAGGLEIHDISSGYDVGTVQYNKNGQNLTYNVVPVTWLGDVGDGRVVNITANSAESLFKYAMKLNPHYLYTNGRKNNSWNHTRPASYNKTSSVHAAATAAEPPVSNQDFPTITSEDSVAKPSAVKTRPCYAQLSAGSTGTCGRIPCSYDDGIWFCQDGHKDISVSWFDLSLYAEIIWRDCQLWEYSDYFQDIYGGVEGHFWNQDDQWSLMVASTWPDNTHC
ncbi:hypothetical protein LTS18_005947 [Coniosporium uncinatum]|uniref:Uncharacterized protein n=1 Tax=Coniosporium uncinatum TaxID=93489 RepID=A0ACC3DB25_9PEZI|nr:hypothetical protein LTS18_005947 [Coniosporium uncinatum]